MRANRSFPFAASRDPNHAKIHNEIDVVDYILEVLVDESSKIHYVYNLRGIMTVALCNGVFLIPDQGAHRPA